MEGKVMSIEAGSVLKLTEHVNDFSQWLMKNLVAPPVKGDGRLIAVRASPDAITSSFRCRFNYSPIATRRSLFAICRSPFATCCSPFAVVLARQEPHPPMFSPTNVGAQFLRHQLRVEARSMIWIDLHLFWENPRLPVSWRQ